MVYQKIINLLDDTRINHLNLEHEIELKQMMIIVTLDLKHLL